MWPERSDQGEEISQNNTQAVQNIIKYYSKNNGWALESWM